MKLGTLLIGLSLVPPCATAGSRAETAPAAKADECRKGHVISGPIEHVRDADIIRVGDVPIRLQGIVTPGLTEPNGIDAAVVVSLLSGSMIGPAICHLTGGQARGGRCIARCVITVDLAKAMVSLGLARDCPPYSGGRYATAESAAHAMLPPSSIARAYELPDCCTDE
jgi:micrococcal nuclease